MKYNKKCTAYNVRFGVMAAVAPQTILCGNERLYPAGSLVEAATTPSRWDVVCKPTEAQIDRKRPRITGDSKRSENR